ncbi:MAG: 50S ribosomal protein L9 [Patescibacteria group bacterium]
MKVILLKDVRGVGMHGTVKEVADGYAINALFPKKLAEPATEEKIKQIQANIAAREAEVYQKEEQLTSKVVSLRGKKVSIQSRATEKGGLFKTVAAGDIVKAIRAEHNLEIPEEAVHIAASIKTLGEHTIELASKTQKVDFIIVITAAL